MLLGPIVDAPVEEWDRMVKLNIQGLLYVAHAALPHLLAPPSTSRAASPTWSTSARSRAGASERRRRVPDDQVGRGHVQRGAAPGGDDPQGALGLIEPGATKSELVTHVRQEVRDALPPGMDEILKAEDIADAIRYMVTRPRHMAINEMLVRPTEQER